MITSQNDNKNVNLVLLFIVIEELQLICFPTASLYDFSVTSLR